MAKQTLVCVCAARAWSIFTSLHRISMTFLKCDACVSVAVLWSFVWRPIKMLTRNQNKNKNRSETKKNQIHPERITSKTIPRSFHLFTSHFALFFGYFFCQFLKSFSSSWALLLLSSSSPLLLRNCQFEPLRWSHEFFFESSALIAIFKLEWPHENNNSRRKNSCYYLISKKNHAVVFIASSCKVLQKTSSTSQLASMQFPLWSDGFINPKLFQIPRAN